MSPIITRPGLFPLQEVEKRFPHGLPLLDPVVDMHIKDEEFRKIVKVI